MAIDLPKRSYTGVIREIKVGDGDKAFTVGGGTCFPFYTFEGQMPHEARMGIEIWDIEPDDWADELKEVYSDVWGDPAAWAKRAVELGADFVQLTLVGTNPNDKDLGPEHAVEVAKKVADAVDVPLSIWGTADNDKDAIVIKAVAEALEDRRLMLGPVEEKNHKQLGAAALAYKHIVVASSPIDINLAKQLNVLLTNLGVTPENILIDPTTGGLGYGLEYSYSVMERARAAALTQQDDMLQYPMYSNLGTEVWKTKEAKLPTDEMNLGDAKSRGILMESVTASCVLAAGCDMLVLRHPETLKIIRDMAEKLRV